MANIITAIYNLGSQRNLSENPDGKLFKSLFLTHNEYQFAISIANMSEAILLKLFPPSLTFRPLYHAVTEILALNFVLQIIEYLSKNYMIVLKLSTVMLLCC